MCLSHQFEDNIFITVYSRYINNLISNIIENHLTIFKIHKSYGEMVVIIILLVIMSIKHTLTMEANGGYFCSELHEQQQQNCLKIPLETHLTRMD